MPLANADFYLIYIGFPKKAVLNMPKAFTILVFMRRMGPRLKRKLKKAAAAYVKRLETGNTKGQRKARQRSHPRMVGTGPIF